MAPLIAISAPVFVSPIFMLEVSIAATSVSWFFGFIGMSVGFRFRLGACICVSVLLFCWIGCWFSWICWFWMCFSECMLSSSRRCGSVVSVGFCGKLYFGVVVIVYCSITKIHQ